MAFQLKIPIFQNIPSKQHAHFITATGIDSNRQKAVSNVTRHNRQKVISNITCHKKAKTRTLQQFANMGNDSIWYNSQAMLGFRFFSPTQ